jgi:hypothetical protein
MCLLEFTYVYWIIVSFSVIKLILCCVPYVLFSLTSSLGFDLH